MTKPKSRKGIGAKAARALGKALGRSRSTASSPKPASLGAPSAKVLSPELSAATGGGTKPNLPGSASGSLPPVASLPAQSQQASTRPVASTTTTSVNVGHESIIKTETVWDGLSTTLRGLHKSAVLFPPLQSAIGGVISCLKTVEDSSRNKSEYEALALELEAIGESLNHHLMGSESRRMSESISRTARLIEQQVSLISSKQNRGKATRMLEVERDEETIIECYRTISTLFQQLQLDASLSMWSIVNRHMVETRLEGLRAAMLATHDSSLSLEINRRTCTDNTRTDVLSGLDDWSTDPDSPSVYWMNGLAGTGKTTIACTFAESLKRRNQLAASFFCTHNSAECQDVTRIIPTIAYQLARYSVPFQSALCRMLH